MERKTWDEYFMGIATMVAERSTCNRLNVGAVLVKDNDIIATGYNGSISGHDHCLDVGHLMHEDGCKRTIHAEMNAILSCAKRGESVENAKLYVTHYPCPECMKHINQVGIKTVIYKYPYGHRYENTFDHGIELIHFEPKEPETKHKAIRWGLDSIISNFMGKG